MPQPQLGLVQRGSRCLRSVFRLTTPTIGVPVRLSANAPLVVAKANVLVFHYRGLERTRVQD